MKKERTEQVPKSVVYSTQCDSCGREHVGGDWIPKGWHRFSSGHGGWGNDSVDSVESYDVCSWPCYRTMLVEAVKEIKEYPGAEVDEFSPEFAEKILEATT